MEGEGVVGVCGCNDNRRCVLRLREGVGGEGEGEGESEGGAAYVGR